MKDLGPVAEGPITANPGLQFCSVFEFNLPMYSFRVTFRVIITMSRGKGPSVQRFFVSSSYMLALYCLLKIWLNYNNNDNYDNYHYYNNYVNYDNNNNYYNYQ